MKNLLLLALVILSVYAAPNEDKVLYQVLGLNGTWYSGYLQFTTGKYHYIFFESQSDPKNDPITWWFNGGPGCSSLLGMFYENGPFVFKENTADFQVNKYGWNLKSNLLYIQSPGGVGFSESFRNFTYDDSTTADDNLRAIRKFYQKFPQYKPNQLYITGQSYAGVYIPFLARAILDFNKLPSRQITINLKGIMMNNACTDRRQCYEPRIAHSNSIYQYEYLYNHGFMTERDFELMQAACILGYNGDYCKEIRKQLDSKFQATNTSIYNIYAKCLYQKTSMQYKLTQSGGRIKLDDGYSCEDDIGILTFLNRPIIQEILHVDTKKLFQVCNQKVSSRYQKTPQQSYPLYQGLIKDKLRIWVTSGDHDADVPITGTLTWINRLKYDAQLPVEEPWREWWVYGLHKNQDQVGGMVWSLRGLTFASIKGAGHMAHKDQRQASYVMLDAFLNGRPLPYSEN